MSSALEGFQKLDSCLDNRFSLVDNLEVTDHDDAPLVVNLNMGASVSPHLVHEPQWLWARPRGSLGAAPGPRA